MMKKGLIVISVLFSLIGFTASTPLTSIDSSNANYTPSRIGVDH